ncbi:hypothetical protein HY479_02985 [Candidatus Uhrbacteria bacterium]|nr:hypothetical protein [Candidatus Uhrbacteria bacterium]
MQMQPITDNSFAEADRVLDQIIAQLDRDRERQEEDEFMAKLAALEAENEVFLARLHADDEDDGPPTLRCPPTWPNECAMEV